MEVQLEAVVEGGLSLSSVPVRCGGQGAGHPSKRALQWSVCYCKYNQAHELLLWMHRVLLLQGASGAASADGAA